MRHFLKFTNLAKFQLLTSAILINFSNSFPHICNSVYDICNIICNILYFSNAISSVTNINNFVR
jgi:hypothetical protein